MTNQEMIGIPLGLALYALIAWVVFLILRAIWRALRPKVSVTGAVRKTGELMTKVEDAYRDGRGR